MKIKSKIGIVATASLAVGAMALTLPSMANESEGSAVTKTGVEAGLHVVKSKIEGASPEKPELSLAKAKYAANPGLTKEEYSSKVSLAKEEYEANPGLAKAKYAAKGN